MIIPVNDDDKRGKDSAQYEYGRWVSGDKLNGRIA